MIARPLTADDPVLDRAVRLIVDQCRPQRILLFGSRARGDAHEHSDYDLMLVVENPSAELESFAKQAARDAGVSADVIVRSAARFEEDRDDVGTLVYAAEHEGRLLYGPPLVPRRVREAGGKPRSVSAWLHRADNDFRSMEQLLSSGQPSWDAICFHAHQGLEKTLKAVLIAGGTPPPRTHELRDLLSRCADELRVDADLERACAYLDALWPRLRYPEAPVPAPREGTEAVAHAQRARARLRRVLEQ